MNQRTRSRPARAARQEADNLQQRVSMEYVDINDIAPYPFNPRKNAEAVESLANTIRTFGFLIPVVIDKDNVLVAGHTRVEAAKRLSLTEVPAVRVDHLTDEQVNAFRLIDNKVAELAKWDFDMLAGEINKLSSSGISLTDFGWTRQELDCMSEMVADDCLSTEALMTAETRENLRRAERRAPATARFVLGELVFFIPATDYASWVNGIRELCDYNEAEITVELKRRLGIVTAAHGAT